jgi:hypothetical protein
VTHEAMLQAGWISPSEPRREQTAQVVQQLGLVTAIPLIQPSPDAVDASAQAAFDRAMVLTVRAFNVLVDPRDTRLASAFDSLVR